MSKEVEVSATAAEELRGAGLTVITKHFLVTGTDGQTRLRRHRRGIRSTGTQQVQIDPNARPRLAPHAHAMRLALEIVKDYATTNPIRRCDLGEAIYTDPRWQKSKDRASNIVSKLLDKGALKEVVAS